MQTSDLTASFTPPRHWIAPEELTADYWADPANLEKRGQEFHDKPVETIALIDKLDTKGFARRDFLQIMGASMAMASLSCARRPVHKIIPYVVKPDETIPGIANYYASTDPETGYGLLVRTREGRPIKLEGNPEHPINQGALSAKLQGSILELYDPERLQEPKTRGKGEAAARAATWADVDTAVQGRLQKAAGSGKVRILSGPILGDASRKLIGEFLGAFGAGSKHVEYSILASDEIAESQAESYGTAVSPAYRFAEADAIVSLGADFLGTWGHALEHTRDFFAKRKLSGVDAKTATMSKLVVFEPTMTITGAKADERYSVRPGDELKIALALANELIVVKGRSRFAGDGAVSTALNGYSVKTVAAEIGIDPTKLAQVAELLWENRGKGIVVAGGLHSQTADAVSLQIAVNLLNSALDNEGATIDGNGRTAPVAAAGFAGLQKLIAEMNSGAVEVLILHRFNGSYMLPASTGFTDAVKKVPFVISLTDREDETTVLADFVLPDHHPLESWGDSQARRGLFGLQQPTIAPLFATRSLQDCLIAWTKGAKLSVSGAATRVESWHDYLVDHWKTSVYPAAGSAMPFEAFWETSLRDGVVQTRAYASARPSARSFRSASLSRVPRYKAAGEGVMLSLYELTHMADGRHANNAWLQEMPEPISTITWDNFLNVGPALAKKMGVVKNDVVEIKVGDKTLELPVCVQPGMHPSAVSVAIGYGRRVCGKVGTGVGVDVFPLISVDKDRLVTAGMPVTLRKTGKVYRLAETQWHNATENRPVVNDITFKEYKANPATANHTDPHLRMDPIPTMWPRHEYKGYRWGMAIDMASCTGCQACVVACQSENNIPVVGRDNVRKSREMHWIRIDRYYSGEADNPEVVFQPMLCQHCENAPCETVCPVLATVHDNEGTNNQIYNRCVGTRYCQNNCPYKVRRFNFFDHWKSYEGTMNLVWNPDVTVRSRGIMEKCSFCVQRIESARHTAKNAGRKIKDGDITPACAQTCPVDGIVFGDINDPTSRVSKLQAEQRGFRSLEILNTRPSITYLSMVRNREPKAHDGAHGGAGEANGHETGGAKSAEAGADHHG